MKLKRIKTYPDWLVKVGGCGTGLCRDVPPGRLYFARSRSDHFQRENDFDRFLRAIHPADPTVPALLGIEDLGLLFFLVHGDQVSRAIPVTYPATRAFLFVNGGWHRSTPMLVLRGRLESCLNSISPSSF